MPHTSINEQTAQVRTFKGLPPALLLPKMAFFRRFSANHFSLVWGCVLLGKNEEYPDKPYGTKVRFGSSGILCKWLVAHDTKQKQLEISYLI